MKIKYPKSISIFGRKFKILFKEIPELDDDGEILIAAQCWKSQNLIIFNSLLKWSRETFYQTLLHEVFHAAFHRVGLNQVNISNDIEELLVENFATCICEIFNLSFKNK